MTWDRLLLDEPSTTFATSSISKEGRPLYNKPGAPGKAMNRQMIAGAHGKKVLSYLSTKGRKSFPDRERLFTLANVST